MIVRTLLVAVAVLFICSARPADAALRLHFQATGSLASDFDNDGSVGFADFLAFVDRGRGLFQRVESSAAFREEGRG